MYRGLFWFKGIAEKTITASMQPDLSELFNDDDRKVAAKSLKRWIPQVNPDDRSHIDAFLAAKMQNKKRVHLNDVLAILKSQRLMVERSCSQDAVFYVVPRANFPKGLSAEQQKWLVTRQELEERYEVRDDDTDFESVYVFMDAVPRASLGKWINQLKFSLKLGRTTRAPRMSAMDDNKPTEESRAASSNDGPEPEQVPGTAPEPPEKKRRLQKQLSATSSDEEEQTLLEIIKQCTEAAAAGRIYSIDKTNTHTVHFWANAVASALQKKTDIQEDAYSVVRQNFGKLLTKLLLNSEGYEDLHHFEEIYRKLQEKGVVLSTLAAPLRKLMLHRIDSEVTLNVEEVDLNAQRRFFTSQLWKTFEKRRAVFLLHKAKDEEHGEKRDRLLKLWDSVPHDSVCPATMAQVQMARSLFLSTLPLPTRVTYALGDEVRMRFAADWKSDFDFSSLV